MGGLGWLVIRFGHVSTTNRWKRATRWQKLSGAQQRDDVNPLTHWTTRYHVQPAVTCPCLDTIVEAFTWDGLVASVVVLVHKKKKKKSHTTFYASDLQDCADSPLSLYLPRLKSWTSKFSVGSYVCKTVKNRWKKTTTWLLSSPWCDKNDSHIQ